MPADVSKIDEAQRLRDRAYAEFGEIAILMNNAGTSPGGGPFDLTSGAARARGQRGVINGIHAFTQR